MSLTRACTRFFDSRSRSLGAAYQVWGRVELVDVEQNTVIARVRGAAPRPYNVRVDFRWLHRGQLVVNCNCPRFVRNGSLCKHVWGTLRAIEGKGVIEAPVRCKQLDVLRLDEVGDVFAEVSPDAVGRIEGSCSPLQADSERTDRMRGEAPGNGRSARVSSGSWQAQLSPLFSSPTPSSSAGWLRENRWQTSCPHEHWYVLNVTLSIQRGGLVIEFFRRKRRANGGWTEFQPWNVVVPERQASLGAEEAELLQLLVGSNSQQPSEPPFYGSRYPLFGQVTRVVVNPVLYEALLPRLNATGRFVWLLDTTLPVDEGVPVTWDAGPAWQLRLRVEPQDAAEQWRLQGELYRGEERRPLTEPVLLLARGLVLFPECLAPLDARDHFAWISALRKHPQIDIPYADRQAFQQALWSSGGPPELDLPAELQLEQVPEEPRGKLSIHAPGENRPQRELRARVSFVYGSHSVPSADPRAAILDWAQQRILPRDPVAEQQLWSQLESLPVRHLGSQAGASNSPSRGSESGEAELGFAVRDLESLVEQLTAAGWLVESEGRLLRRAGEFSMRVTTTLDWFELDGHVDFDGVQVGLPRLLAAIRKRHKYVRLDDGTRGILPSEWLQQFGKLVDLGEGSEENLRFRPSQALLLDSLLAAQEQAVQVDTPYARLRERLRTFSGVKAGQEPRGFRGQLRGYQKDGLGWLNFLREFRFGGCLADDMGLGKTVQVLALLQARRTRPRGRGQPRLPSLVVVPKSLVFNWIDEASRFAPRLRVGDYTGPDRQALLDQLEQYDFLVTTYGTLRRDIVHLKELRFDYVILDESQAIKNANSQAAKACRLLQADHRLAMTGTPIENHLGELWSLFEFLNPGMLGRSRTFRELIKQGGEDEKALQLLSRSLRPFLLRRTKQQVLGELPEKTEQTLYCEMGSKQRKLYDEMREYYRRSLAQRVEEVGLERSKIHVLEALLRLRQAACHPGLLDDSRVGESSAKMDLLLEQLREIVAEGHKALVFSQFTSLLALVRQQLDKLGLTYEYLDGQTRNRRQRVQRFQEDVDCSLFLISLKAGGHGLNLTAADYVFILDPWWNPAVESQAIDRAHRLGQTRNVCAYRLICRDTVEDKIVELQRNKRELAEAIISADNNLIRELNAEDLQLLLS